MVTTRRRANEPYDSKPNRRKTNDNKWCSRWYYRFIVKKAQKFNWGPFQRYCTRLASLSSLRRGRAALPFRLDSLRPRRLPGLLAEDKVSDKDKELKIRNILCWELITSLPRFSMLSRRKHFFAFQDGTLLWVASQLAVQSVGARAHSLPW